MDSEECRSWSDLPLEILSSIADRLPFLELSSFRATCRDFRSASSTASGEHGLQDPWLLFYKPNNSECLIYNTYKEKAYPRNISDLQGAICLASYKGWMLLSKDESIFFFSPFSLVKIALPDFPHATTDSHVAAFSDLPTSPNCIVSVIRSIDDDLSVEINMLSKGQSSWTQHKMVKESILKSAIVAATFDQKTRTFYYMDRGESVLTFRVDDNSSKPYHVVENEYLRRIGRTLPYSFFFSVFGKWFERKEYPNLDIEDDESVAVCGLTYEPVKSRSFVYLNEAVGVSPTKTSMRRAVWIQPRFFEAHQDMCW